jgi:iron complex transport system substrate-binding protein
VLVSLENVYSWNPDVIIIRDAAPLSPNDFYNDPKWRGINAVIDKRIYKEHANWSGYRIETFFGLMEKAKWLNPNLFDTLDPEQEYEHFFALVASLNKA